MLRVRDTVALLIVLPAIAAAASWIAVGTADGAILWIVFAAALVTGVRSSQVGAGRWSPLWATGCVIVTSALFLVIFVAAVAVDAALATPG